MDRRSLPPLRGLPRFFIPAWDAGETRVELDKDVFDRIHHVLRLKTGDRIALLPNDGTLWEAVLDGRSALLDEQHAPDTESARAWTLTLSLPKADKLEDIIRACTELGVARFELIETDRTVVKWDAKKREDRCRRLESIARESAELAFRTRLPEILWRGTLAEVLTESTLVLSEAQGLEQTFEGPIEGKDRLVVGPEGGWSPRESTQVREYAVTLGPRVLRVETAAITACALALCRG